MMIKKDIEALLVKINKLVGNVDLLRVDIEEREAELYTLGQKVSAIRKELIEMSGKAARELNPKKYP